MYFKGETTSPWHVRKRKYSDYLYTRDDYLWGRGIRGPVLRQLWRTFCPKSDAHDGVKFDPEKDCLTCINANECPFHNLIGSADEGEFKDKPNLIVTNLRFTKKVNRQRVALATLNDKHLGVVEEKAPVFIEYLPEETPFEFETIFMAEGAKFAEQFESAVKTSIQFLGWGGFCNEGFGRGTITSVENNGFNDFDHEYIEREARKIMEKTQKKEDLTFTISPILILEKNGAKYYKSILEEGFHEKLCNCINERYWQLYGQKIYVQNVINEISGRTRTLTISGWSRAYRRSMPFLGLGNEITFHCTEETGIEEAKAFTILRYGVGRYKNEGFGSVEVKFA